MPAQDDKLLVRVYDVGCGDCIYLRIPDADRSYHILIDCGNFFGESSKPVKAALDDIKQMLSEGAPPGAAGQLDLLVATHRHWDHLKGFELDQFSQMKVKRIWVTVAMDQAHQEATGLRALHSFVEETARSLQARGLNLSSKLHAFLMNSLSTQTASQALLEKLPQTNGIEPSYVYRGFEQALSDEQRATQLLEFNDPSIKLKVLAPEKEIDATYLHQLDATASPPGLHGSTVVGNAPENQPEKWPPNISKYDYQRLRTQLLHVGLGMAAASNHVTNNTSVVLLLEWRGRRLLFPGDAEWGFEQDQKGSWEVMWAAEKDELSQPLDFLKVSHHGSVNATPWNIQNPDHPINEILDALLPLPGPGESSTAQAVVSTRISKIRFDPRLMEQLGKRVANTRTYPGEPDFPQPQRTDKEDEPWITISMEPAPGWSPGT